MQKLEELIESQAKAKADEKAQAKLDAQAELDAIAKAKAAEEKKEAEELCKAARKEVFAKLAERYELTQYGTKQVCFDKLATREDSKIIPLDTMRELTSHILVPRINDKDKLVYDRAFDQWKDYKQSIGECYSGIDFFPQSPHLIFTSDSDEKYINTFRGFAVDACRATSCKRLLNHIRKVICSNDESIYNWYMTFHADIFQHPERKPGTTLGIKGHEGVGKSIIYDKVFSPMLGKYMAKESKIDNITGHNNSILSNKLMLIGEEAIWKGKKDVFGIIKDLITAPTLHIKRLYFDPVEETSYIRTIWITNNDWSGPSEINGRRWTILQAQDYCDGVKLSTDATDTQEIKTARKDYFDSLIDEIDNGGIEAFYEYLMAWDCTKANIKTCLATEASKVDMAFSFDIVDTYFSECANNETKTSRNIFILDKASKSEWDETPNISSSRYKYEGEKVWIATSTLKTLVNRYYEESGYTDYYNPRELGAIIVSRKYGKEKYQKIDGLSVRGFEIDLQAVKAKFWKGDE